MFWSAALNFAKESQREGTGVLKHAVTIPLFLLLVRGRSPQADVGGGALKNGTFQTLQLEHFYSSSAPCLKLGAFMALSGVENLGLRTLVSMRMRTRVKVMLQTSNPRLNLKMNLE